MISSRQGFHSFSLENGFNPDLRSLDGSQHFEEEHEKTDIKRDAELNKLGLRVIRYTNDDIKKHFYDVCTDLAEVLGINIEDIKIEA